MIHAKDSAACVADAVEESHGPQPPRLSNYDEDRRDAMLKDGSLKVITSTIELELRLRRGARCPADVQDPNVWSWAPGSADAGLVAVCVSSLDLHRS